MTTITIKIGGNAAAEASIFLSLAEEIKSLSGINRFLIIHGGGAELSRVSRRLGFEPVFKDGIRMTAPEEMDIADMVLGGFMNKRLVRLCRRAGHKAVGLSGSDGDLIIGRSIDSEGNNRTGRIISVNSCILTRLMDLEYLPVIASISTDESGRGLNINADEAAFGIAAEMQSETLLFLSDTPGIVIDGTPVPSMNEKEMETGITGGEIWGGMIPKTRSSLKALRSGVGKIVIGKYGNRGDLEKLLKGDSGTRLFI
jgi:acetylglutamate kinase